MKKLLWFKQMNIMKVILLFLLMALPLFSIISSVYSTDVVTTEVFLGPIEDAYVNSDKPYSNFGESSYLYAELSDYQYIQDVYRNSYLKFDVSSVSKVDIVFARLELYCWFLYATPDVGAYYCLDDSWNENTITWDDAPSFSSKPTNVVQVNADDQWYTWNITRDVKSSVDDGALTVVLRVENVGGFPEASFYSKEGWKNHPRLVIEYAKPISCSVSPWVVTLGDSIMVSGSIPIARIDDVQLIYTRPNMSSLARPVTTDSFGNFTDTYEPDSVGVWRVTAAWDGAEGCNASSATDVFVVTENKRDNWAIVIGVKDYKDPGIKDTWYADKDAIELYNKLSEVWPGDHIKLLIDEEATKSNIESAIKDWLAPNETMESVVLFFFSGHGSQGTDVAPDIEPDGKDEYICPYDSLEDSYDNDIRDDTLDNWLDTLNSQCISVFLHSCHSGGFINKMTGKELPPSDLGDGLAKDLSEIGRVIITACEETESAWEYRALEHGVFPYYILEGLGNMELLDGNGDNEISAEEIFSYVEPLVMSYTDGDQHPQMYDGYEGELTLITTLTINLDTDPLKASITIDEVIYTPPVSFIWPLYTEHTFSISQQDWPELVGTRYLFTSWSDGNNSTSRTIIVSEFLWTNYTGNYQIQHYLTVSSDCGDPQGEGWYDNGATAPFGVSSPIDYGNGTRVVFAEWSGNTSTVDLSSSVVMDAPKHVLAQWKTQHYLTVSSEFGDPQGEGWYDAGAVASFDVAPLVDFGNGTRVVFTEWSGDTGSTDSNFTVVMDAPKNVSAQWKKQHYLDVNVNPSGIATLSGEGWYDEGSIAQTGNAPSIVTGDEGMRHLLETWKVDGVAEDGNSISVNMDSPHSTVAYYRAQYYLMVVSQYGQPEGEGWYDEDSVAAFSVKSPQGFIVQKVFVGWSGDSTSTSTSAIIVMNSPKTVTASWTDEYTQLYVVLAAAALIMISIIVVKKFSGR